MNEERFIGEFENLLPYTAGPGAETSAVVFFFFFLIAGGFYF